MKKTENRKRYSSQKIFFICLLSFALGLGFGVRVNAATYYFTNTGNGAENGKSLSDAWAITSFNKAANWASTPTMGKISPGDTVYICGTVTPTSSLIPIASGTADNKRIDIRGDCSTQGGDDGILDIRSSLSGTWTRDGLSNRWYITVAGAAKLL